MPLEVIVPSPAWTTQDITLGGFKYNFIYSFNERDNRWRIDIYNVDNTPVITGVKIMENQSLLERYILEDFNHGDIYCLRIHETPDPVGRDNLGPGLAYSLFYFTNEEIAGTT